MQRIARARQICKLVLQMGPDRPYSVSTLYWILRLNVDALDGVKTEPSETSAHDKQTLRVFSIKSINLILDKTIFFGIEQVYVKWIMSQIFFAFFVASILSTVRPCRTERS